MTLPSYLQVYNVSTLQNYHGRQRNPPLIVREGWQAVAGAQLCERLADDHEQAVARLVSAALVHTCGFCIASQLAAGAFRASPARLLLLPQYHGS